jgi:hypothetical protein
MPSLAFPFLLVLAAQSPTPADAAGDAPAPSEEVADPPAPPEETGTVEDEVEVEVEDEGAPGAPARESEQAAPDEGAQGAPPPVGPVDPVDPAEAAMPLPAEAPPNKASQNADPDTRSRADDDEHGGDHMHRDHGPTVTEQVQETVGAVVEAARPVQTNHSFDVGLTVSAGAGACHLLVAPCGAGSGTFVGIPYISVGPGVGFSGQYQYRLGDSWRLSFSGDFSIGGFKEGSLLGQLGSYNGRLGLTFVWFEDALGFTLTSEPHLGLSSISLVPIPLAGVTNELSFSPLFWLEQQWVVWNISAAITTDLLVISPYPSVSVSSLFLARVFGAFIGMEAAAGAEAKIGLLANSVGGSVGVRFVGGYAF